MNEAVKFEVPQIQLSGKYKIQLFDKDTNELIKEVEKHNIISKIPFSASFYNNIYSGFISNTNNTGCGIPKTDNYINFLILTNDPDSPENDDKNPVVLGELVGYAEYKFTDSNSDLKKGVFNKNETTTIYNNYPNGARIKNVTNHIVFDFPTDKANGTFDNIYLAPFPDFSHPNDYRGVTTDYKQIIRISNNGDYNDDESIRLKGDAGGLSNSEKYLYMHCLYYKDKPGIQHWDKIAQIDLETWERKYITLNVPSKNSSNPAYIIYACGMFWRIEANYNTTRYNLDGTYKDYIDIKGKISGNILNLDGAKEYIGDNTNCYKYLYFDYFTGDDDNLYLSYISKITKDSMNIYEIHIFSLDANGNIVSDALIGIKNGDKPDNTIPINIAYINNKKYILTPGSYNMKNKVFTSENGILNEKCSETLNKLSHIGRTFFYSKNGFVFITGGDMDNWPFSLYVRTLLPWSSHCKLSSPVTKTSANTMKIQYDVTVDYIMPGMISNLK
ncbi:hypothetical protein [Clostridium perfringens]|uniref:hypothetical protein n=1 Tax=Clostridium perfringens TaxID=1502 RepID=UPI0024BC3EB0|nr:hypothetical protein [Clostridium perfringens]CAJ1869555.1 hypothetical protein AUSP0004_00008 [uncultured phage]